MLNKIGLLELQEHQIIVLMQHFQMAELVQARNIFYKMVHLLLTMILMVMHQAKYIIGLMEHIQEL